MKIFKNLSWLFIDLALLSAVLLGVEGFKFMQYYGASFSPARTVTVNADAKISVKPDIARMNFGATTEGKEPDVITDENSKKISAAIELLKNQGIDEKDIKTGGYNLSPRYEFDSKKKTSYISGYTVTQNVVIKVRDFQKIGIILSRLPALGINQASPTFFEVDDPEVYLKIARDKAFQKAFLKATVMARENNVRLGRVVTMTENTGGNIYPRIFAEGGPSSPLSALPTPVEPGTEDVSVYVSVTYELR